MGCKNITEQTKHRLQAYNIDKINTTPILTDCETLHLFQRPGIPLAEERKRQQEIKNKINITNTYPY